MPAVIRRPLIASSSMSAGERMPAATSRASDCDARTSSMRLPYEMKMFRCSVSFAAVVLSISSTARRAPSVRRSRSPRMRTRTPRAESSATSLAMYSSSSDISAETSVVGRCQFSWLNANSERCVTPASIAPWTTSRTAFMPERWPTGRGMKCLRAQRPLPSMMMATCCGGEPASRTCSSRSGVDSVEVATEVLRLP